MEIKFRTADPSNHYAGRDGNQIRYIVLHYTANNGDTAKNNADYFADANRRASAHYFVDEREVWQSVRDTDAAWHCGGAIESVHHPLRGICTNRNSLGVEMCSDIVGGRYVITGQTVTRAVELVKMLMAKYSVPIDRVVRHYDVTGKACPEPWVRDESQWAKFKARLVAPEVKKEVKKVTYDEFCAYMARYQKELEAKTASVWAEKAWKALTDAGVTDGTQPQSPLTREQFAVMMHRMGLTGKGV